MLNNVFLCALKRLNDITKDLRKEWRGEIETNTLIVKVPKFQCQDQLWPLIKLFLRHNMLKNFGLFDVLYCFAEFWTRISWLTVMLIG